MERTLTQQLRAIAQGYEAARFREELLATYAIPNRGAFKQILRDEYPNEDHHRLSHQALIEGPAFMEGWDRTCTLEEWRERKEQELLRSESGILWAVEMVERGVLPSNPRLAAHVLWVKSFLLLP